MRVLYNIPSLAMPSVSTICETALPGPQQHSLVAFGAACHFRRTIRMPQGPANTHGSDWSYKTPYSGYHKRPGSCVHMRLAMLPSLLSLPNTTGGAPRGDGARRRGRLGDAGQ
jgi:hypothetical protein